MKLEDQVCSLEPAKRLKELGVKQESYFYWNCFTPPTGSLSPYEEIQDHKHSQATEHFSAFTVAELGEMLPTFYKGGQLMAGRFKDKDGWWVSYFEDGCYEPTTEADTEARARAKMLIYLIEQGLVSPEAI